MEAGDVELSHGVLEVHLHGVGGADGVEGGPNRRLDHFPVLRHHLTLHLELVDHAPYLVMGRRQVFPLSGAEPSLDGPRLLEALPRWRRLLDTGLDKIKTFRACSYNGVLQPIFRSFNSWLEMELLRGNQFSSIVKLKLICYK